MGERRGTVCELLCSQAVGRSKKKKKIAVLPISISISDGPF